MDKKKDIETREIIDRAGSCINSYFDFYQARGWNGKKLCELKNKFCALQVSYVNDPKQGGVCYENKILHKAEAFETLMQIGKSRHSIRDFESGQIDISKIYSAIEFAQMAPSACNRQSVRCHIINKSEFPRLKEWLDSVGYFENCRYDKLVLITAKITGYNTNEGMQHLVSPGIFVGYLVLALEALNIGSCVIQRPLDNNKKWQKAKKELNIPEDEQQFCLVGCGLKKEKYKVPVSKRLSL